MNRLKSLHIIGQRMGPAVCLKTCGNIHAQVRCESGFGPKKDSALYNQDRPGEDEFPEFKVQAGKVRASQALKATMAYTPLYRESFAFQEHADVSINVVREYKDKDGILKVKWDIAEEEDLRNRQVGGPKREKFGPPENFRPRPKRFSDRTTLRHPEPIEARCEDGYIPPSRPKKVERD